MVGSGWANLASATRRTDLDKELATHLLVIFPLAWDVVLVIDGLDWADWLAGAAIHALVGLDVEHAIALINAIDRALLDT